MTNTNLAQELIKKNHPSIMGLKSTLIIQNRSYCYPEAERSGRFLQVIHLAGGSGHWILAPNIGERETEIIV